ncbi:MAG: hypothetical protein K2Z25_02075 [Beijerinckiaceae bacterium]|nr:hypothetical protein [Beijerinckiaceae bacterium]
MPSHSDNDQSKVRPRLTLLDDRLQPDDRSEAQLSKRQTRIVENEDQPDDLTDHELRLKLSDMAGQIYLRGWHRNVAMLTPAEAAVIATAIVGLATSDDAIKLYDDVLEQNEATIGALLDSIKTAANRMQQDIEAADRRYHKHEAEAWAGQPGSA